MFIEIWMQPYVLDWICQLFCYDALDQVPTFFFSNFEVLSGRYGFMFCLLQLGTLSQGYEITWKLEVEGCFPQALCCRTEKVDRWVWTFSIICARLSGELLPIGATRDSDNTVNTLKTERNLECVIYNRMMHKKMDVFRLSEHYKIHACMKNCVTCCYEQFTFSECTSKIYIKANLEVLKIGGLCR